jgi:C4-dicarboxylate-binding protein DctP
VRAFELFDLPYVFPNKETLYRVMDGDIGKKLFGMLEAKGITGLAFWDNGFKQMSANKPMRTVEDFKGLKMRIQSSKVLEAQMKALGANPQVMAFSEVYSALQQGVVDGTENPMSNLYTQKMHEVQKHLTLSDHGYLGYAVIVNKAFWAGLPADIRATLDKAMADTTVFERKIAQEENDEALAKVKAAGYTQIYTLPYRDRVVWQQALLPVHKEFEEKIGRDLINSAYLVAAQVEKEKGRPDQGPRRQGQAGPANGKPAAKPAAKPEKK